MKFVRLALAITVSLVLLCSLCPAVQADDDKAEVKLKVKIVPPPLPPGAGGGPVPDTMAPTMSNILASNITEMTADIRWRTDEWSTSQVEYWSSPGMLSPLDETMVYKHHVHLTDLTPGTNYHYKTMSRDAAGNLAVSDEYTFTTKGKAPAPPPEPAPAPPPEPAPPPPPAPPEVPINWPLIGGIIGGVIVVGVVIFFWIRRRVGSQNDR